MGEYTMVLLASRKISQTRRLTLDELTSITICHFYADIPVIRMKMLWRFWGHCWADIRVQFEGRFNPAPCQCEGLFSQKEHELSNYTLILFCSNNVKVWLDKAGLYWNANCESDPQLIGLWNLVPMKIDNMALQTHASITLIWLKIRSL